MLLELNSSKKGKWRGLAGKDKEFADNFEAASIEVFDTDKMAGDATLEHFLKQVYLQQVLTNHIHPVGLSAEGR